ncbi:uncharacterized protein LOC133834256 isoform X3 [Humulus lupulus]|uniref:uncharacterized protein LOC133834256 isoform X3 n=1 Tax=Humulus lupulus TaxID=3486 RepID=UPI002B417C1D|nr:uncharacterized protein LOC133834256 isoform X3 [Humulus lupulus]
MAFMKVFLALLLLAVVASTTHARVDLLGMISDNNAPFCPIGPTKCASCTCEVESGNLKCVRRDTRRGACPSTCGNPCLCDRSACPLCQCSYEVVGCPRICPTTPSTTVFEEIQLITDSS